MQMDEAPSDDALRELVSRARAEGAGQIVIETSHDAGEAWIRKGFRETSRILVADAASLEGRLSSEHEASYGAIHVQSDDLEAITRAVRQFVPRLPGGSKGSVVVPPRDGWITVHDEVCDREPEMLRRLARELSDRTGSFVVAIGAEEGSVVRYVALERGRVVDEYLSVPEYHGPLPPGDVIGLGSNPRLMGRLTGADADAIRAVAKTAQTPAELPPADELYGSLVQALALPGSERTYAEARAIPGALDIPR